MRETVAVVITTRPRKCAPFRVAALSKLGTKRGRGPGAFIDSILGAIDSFYAGVLGDLKAGSAAPPKMRQVSPTELALH